MYLYEVPILVFYGLKLIKVDGPKMWNSLPNSIRNINSLNKFVKGLKYYLGAEVHLVCN